MRALDASSAAFSFQQINLTVFRSDLYLDSNSCARRLGFGHAGTVLFLGVFRHARVPHIALYEPSLPVSEAFWLAAAHTFAAHWIDVAFLIILWESLLSESISDCLLASKNLLYVCFPESNFMYIKKRCGIKALLDFFVCVSMKVMACIVCGALLYSWELETMKVTCSPPETFHRHGSQSSAHLEEDNVSQPCLKAL
jgi:hypothetical protein